MTDATSISSLTGRELGFFRALFVISAIWNFAGAFPGLMDSAGMFEREFGRVLVDPVLVAVYRGAWGTAMLYGFGFLVVAYNPGRHTGIVLMGGLGKALFAFNLLGMYLNGWTSNFAIVVIGGDVIFVLLFLIYVLRMRHHGHGLI